MSSHKSLPRVLPAFDNCIMGPTTQLNWLCLSLTTWLAYSQRKRRPTTGLGYQPFIRHMCTLQLAAQEGQVTNKHLFSQGPRPEHSSRHYDLLTSFSCCDVLEQSSPTKKIPSHQRSPRFKNTAHRMEYTTLDATFLGPHEEVGRQ